MIRRIASIFIVVLSAAACDTVRTVEVSPASATLTTPGQRQQLTAVARTKEGKVVENVKWRWTSSSQAADVDANGLVTAKKSGSVEIKANAGEPVGVAKIEVQIPAEITVEPAALTLTGMGTAAPLNARVKDDAGRPIENARVEFEAATPGIVGIVGGQVIATAPGTTAVLVKLGPLEARAQVTVNLPAFAKLTVGPEKPKLAVGATQQLSPLAMDDAGNGVPGMAFGWTSSSEKVASVDARGLVTAVGKGKATITATAGGKSVSTTVEVK